MKPLPSCLERGRNKTHSRVSSRKINEDLLPLASSDALEISGPFDRKQRPTPRCIRPDSDARLVVAVVRDGREKSVAGGAHDGLNERIPKSELHERVQFDWNSFQEGLHQLAVHLTTTGVGRRWAQERRRAEGKRCGSSGGGGRLACSWIVRRKLTTSSCLISIVVSTRPCGSVYSA